MKCFEDEMITVIYWQLPGNLLTVFIFAKIHGQKFPENLTTFCRQTVIDIATYSIIGLVWKLLRESPLTASVRIYGNLKKRRYVSAHSIHSYIDLNVISTSYKS